MMAVRGQGDSPAASGRRRHKLRPRSAPPGPQLSFGKRIKRRAVYVLLRGWAALARGCPRDWALWAGAAFGRTVAAFDTRRASTAAERVATALGVQPSSARTTVRAMYAHFGRLLVEVMTMPRTRAELVAQVEMSADAEQCLQAALAEGRGLILVSGHIGNWELTGQRIAAGGFDLTTVARPVRNALIGRWLHRQRTALGLKVIERGHPSAARRILATLRRGGALGLLIDQRIDVPSVDVPFFGFPASTPVGAAALAVRSQRPIIVIASQRAPDGRHRIHFEPVPLPSSGDTASRCHALTARLNLVLEAMIRRAPEQWPWIHDRWRGAGPLDATTGRHRRKL